ncbi:hypothetical protein [Chromobacterium sp.]|uniref:hypothetical protein n=1 Tax=Chromobacterium sp. TaxID=306190 RepID=UPI0035B3E78C
MKTNTEPLDSQCFEAGDGADAVDMKLARKTTHVLANQGLICAAVSMEHAETLRGILSAISRLSQDSTVVSLADHGHGVAAALHNEADVFREEVESMMQHAGGWVWN